MGTIGMRGGEHKGCMDDGKKGLRGVPEKLPDLAILAHRSRKIDESSVLKSSAGRSGTITGEEERSKTDRELKDLVGNGRTGGKRSKVIGNQMGSREKDSHAPVQEEKKRR
ncbi:unnamed protein product [Microthlaspi erraticum]|uniref:Uncharacterized protein n=1 Tax=Microthlaspi erraticum TaxID=1685480 RepID=A0A6D2JW82_9BRAS|nr:unnamed protein product [Microthlaspi erraticum]